MGVIFPSGLVDYLHSLLNEDSLRKFYSLVIDQGGLNSTNIEAIMQVIGKFLDNSLSKKRHAMDRLMGLNAINSNQFIS